MQTTSAQPAEAEGTTLDELTALLGKTDAQTADLLGGGQENWTEDRSFFIGRIYETTLLDAPVKVYTTCDNDDAHTVASVSVWRIS